MLVRKRSGRMETIRFDKIVNRVEQQSYGLNTDYVQPHSVALKVFQGLYDGVPSTEIDKLIAETSASLTTHHPDYSTLAARIAVSNLHKCTSKSFSSTMKHLFQNKDPKTGNPAPLLSRDAYKVVQEHAAKLDESIIHARDFTYDYFAIRTLERGYLMKVNDQIAERPQHMLMRVALGIHGGDVESVIDTYNMLSEKWYTHATPTLFNSATPKPQLSSCFLLTIKDDSIDGIYDTLKQCAKISQSAGGIGLSVSNVRAKGSYIKGTGGTSNGLVPMLRNFDMTARYVDQGGGKRKGSIAIYIEPWHADIEDVLDLKLNHGKEEVRARDLFYALWVPDLFMRRVDEDDTWSLFCPNESPGLMDVHSEEFERLYEHYERSGKARKTVQARALWEHILKVQQETGQPFFLYKDAANRKSNQKNLGTIRSSNLCTEIIEYSSPEEIAVCNLASINLPKFISNGSFDHQQLYTIVKKVTVNLNKLIDNNYYPVEEGRVSNLKHRPIGIGVQGLADVFIMLDMAFESNDAKQLNRDIFETIYFAALSASKDLAKEQGPYESYAGSPISKGIFQFDMWGVKPSNRWDFEKLKYEILSVGVRNSLLVAPMPTASTSQILGNNECFEPYTSNIYTRRTLSGEFIVVNKHLTQRLINLGLWDNTMRQRIIDANGSIQNIKEIPLQTREVFKTAFEIKQKAIIDLSADRGAFICQSQSLNIHMENVNYAKLTSLHFYAWKAGLKTGMYYLRSQSAAEPIKFTIDKAVIEVPVVKKRTGELELSMVPAPVQSKAQQELSCSLGNPDGCESCGA